MNDIKSYRRIKSRAERRDASARYWGSFSYALEVTWPRGVLGRTCGVIILLCPVWVIIMATWLATRLPRRRARRDSE